MEGERLQGSEGDATQDFVMANAPAFGALNGKKFLGSLKLLATTDKAEGAKKVLSAALRGAEAVVEAFGGKSATLVTLGGQPETHILGEIFYSQAPLLWGPYMAKVCVAPVSPELAALIDASLNVNGKPNGLREAVVEFFRRNGAEWELRVQLCTDLDTMPVEDASVAWPEDQSRAPTFRSPASACRPRLPGARRVRRPWTTASRSARGTAWRRTARSGPSCARAGWRIRGPRSSGANATAARSTSRRRRPTCRADAAAGSVRRLPHDQAQP